MISETKARRNRGKQARKYQAIRLLPLSAALAAAGIGAIPGLMVSGELHAQQPPTPGVLAGMAEPLTYARPAVPKPAPPSAMRAPNDVTVLNCNNSGPGSLREAVSNAISGDTVDMTQLTCSTISLTESIVFGQEQLALHGPGRNQLMLDASGITTKNGVLAHVAASGTLFVRDLAIRGGRKYNANGPALGGCIHTTGNLVMSDVTLSDCKVQSQDQHPALGGAIWTNGTAYLARSSVSGSTADAQGNGYASGGGVYALGGFSSVGSVITNNAAFAQSSTPSFGGGVFARGYASIVGSTIADNFAERLGGLAFADNAANQAVMSNSTVSGNFATQVGGMYSRQPLQLYNSTIANNWASVSVDNSSNPVAAGLQMGAVTLTSHSTIIANNYAVDTQSRNDLNGKPGVLVAGSHNLFTSSALPPPPDTIGAPSGLGPLQDNGGLTPTHALLLGQSLAIEYGGAPPGGAGLYDQRGPGFPRSIGTSIDIGAFEFDPDRIFTNGFDYATQKQTAR